MESWFKQGLAPLYATAPVFASSDPREAKQGTTGALTEHDLVWRSGRVDSVLRKASAGHLSFMILRYGAAVSIAPGELGRFLLFQVPLAGAAQIRVGNHTVLADSGRAAIISPTTALQLDWSEGCEQLLVKVPRQRIEAVCGALIGAELHEPIEFYPEVDLSTVPGRAWQHYITLMLSGLSLQERAVPPSWWKAQEDALLHHLLLCQPNNYTERLTRPRAARRNVRAAEDYIRSNIDGTISLATLAQVAGCSVRGLTLAFQEQYGMPPMAFVRQLRLEQARRDLLQAPPGARVTDIALRWGFTHLGRFCSQYKRRYGETPLQSLAR